MTRRWHTAIAFAAAMLATLPAVGRELAVGPNRALKVPSQAATIAQAGDVIRIDAGTYADCATWKAPNLLIEAAEPGVVLAGKTCAGKGIFIIEGANITIRGITFARASVVWHNGAGIRVAGANLTVENSRFIENENGILAGGPPFSVLRITDSEFIGNGACIDACAHGVYAGEPIYLLDIEHSIFHDNKIAHHIKSRARNTIVRDSRIEDGANGTTSYLIDVPNGGNVLIEGNTMQKGAHSSNPGVAISLGIEGATNRTDVQIIKNNSFRNDLPNRTIFVRNTTGTPVVLSGNTVSGNVLPETEARDSTAK